MGRPFIFNTKHMSGEISHANEREIYFLIAFLGMLGQWFISNESIKCTSPSCCLNALGHILTSLFTRNKTQRAIKERQPTRGSMGETMRHPAAQHKSRVAWGWGVLGNFDLSQSGTHGSVERKFLSLYSEKALGKLGRTAHTGYCWCQLRTKSEELKDLGGSRTGF